MKTFFQKLWLFVRQPLPAVLLGVLIVLLVIVTFVLGGGDDLSQFDIATVQTGTVVQEVSVSGRVEPAEELDLAVERGGRVVSAPVSVGQQVARGQLLVAVSSGTLSAQRQEAQAALEREQLRLAQLQNRSGGTAAGSTLENARTSLNNAIRTGFISVDSALAAYIDPFYRDPRTSPDFTARFETSTGKTIVIEGTALERYELQALRRQVSEEMNEWESAKVQLEADTDKEAAVARAYSAIATADELSVKLSALLAGRVGDEPEERALLTTLRSNVTSARSSLVATQTSINGAEATLNAAKTGFSQEEIRFQELAVVQARSRLSAINAQLAEAAILAPITGTVTRQEARVGEYVNPATPVVTLASSAQFEIEAFVPEADIAKISAGDNAEVTLDAFDSDDIFKAEVVAIDPAETLTEGIATFKIILHFTGSADTSQLRPGMTADLDILTGHAENVIAVPQRAVIERDGRSYIRVVDGESLMERAVTTGLRGTEGTIEITSGLEEGEQIVIFERT